MRWERRQGRISNDQAFTTHPAAVVGSACRRRQLRPGALRPVDDTATLTASGIWRRRRARRRSTTPSRASTRSIRTSRSRVDMDPITTGWGDYVTKVLGQFNAGNRRTTSTAPPSRRSRPSRRAACSCRSTTSSPRTRASPISRRACSSRAPTRARPISSRSAGTTS